MTPESVPGIRITAAEVGAIWTPTVTAQYAREVLELARRRSLESDRLAA